jgi:hypothetical protein
MEFLRAIEASGFAMWVKESSTAYVAILAFHTIGLAFLVGISGGLSMRLLGVAKDMPIEPFEDFFPLMWAGFWTNAVTGAVLMTLYPTQYLTDPTIYIKLGAVALAMGSLRLLRGVVFGEKAQIHTDEGLHTAKRLSKTVLVAWMIAVVTGRVMAYTMPTKLQTGAAFLVSAILMAAAGYLLARSMGWLSPAQPLSAPTEKEAT